MMMEVFELSLPAAVMDSFVTNGLLLISILMAVNVLKFYQPKADRFIFLVASAAVLSTLVVLGDHWLLNLIFSSEEKRAFFERTLHLRGGFSLLANAAAIGLSMQWYRISEQQELQERKDEAERMSKEAELFKLRHQLQPHFLFNSLNSINALINTDPKQARTMVQQLSAFLRGTIRGDDKQSVSLLEEVEYLQLYLSIEKVRFGHRLQTMLEVEDAAHKAILPPLLLQPLMENAIKFGLYGIIGDVEITMQARVEGNYLRLVIGNPVDPDAETQSGTGFGLNSIRRRLYLIYGRNDLLETHKTTTHFTATLRIPQTP